MAPFLIITIATVFLIFNKKFWGMFIVIISVVAKLFSLY